MVERSPGTGVNKNLKLLVSGVFGEEGGDRGTGEGHEAWTRWG